MKRVILHFMYLWILLLGGGELMHASILPKNIIESPSFDFVKKHHVRYKTLESNNVLLEEAAVDLDEDFHGSETLKKSDFNNFINKHSLSDNWYLILLNPFNLKDYTQQNTFVASTCGYYNPIYLSIGVLRI
jgi:hypothetical protein